MKALIHPDGTVELEIHNGDGQAALDLIRSLQGAGEATVEEEHEVLLDSAVLTPAERSVYEVLAEHRNGCHVTVVATELTLSRSVANSRLVALTNRGFAERIMRGTYRLIGDDVD